MNQPAWAKPLKKERKYVDQITFLSGPKSQFQSQASAGQNYGYGYTGAGVDGVIQPGKMAGQVHEGEGVIRANAMQNLDPQEFQVFQASLESGKLDKNKFREAIGMVPILGYQSGGIGGDEPYDPLKTDSGTTSVLDKDDSDPLNTGSGIIPGLNREDSDLVLNRTRDMASGKAFEPISKAANTYDLLQTETLAKAGKNLQQSAANTAASRGWTGQGAGNQLQGQVDQMLMSNLSNNLLQRGVYRNDLEVQRQNMMNQGTQGLLNIGSQIELFNQQNKIDTGKRINTLIASGADLNRIVNDQLLRGQLAKDLGLSPDDDAITQEIQTLYNASIDTNADAYGGDAETILQDYITSGKTVEDALNDQNLFRKTALSMRLDPNDANSAKAIREEIVRRFNDRSMNDVDRAYKNIMDSGIIGDEYKSVPGFDKDLRNMIQDLSLKGLIDPETGALKEGAIIEWPWEDPDTFFKYNDFNGNELDGKRLDTNATINIKGNGSTYKNSAGREVNQYDAITAWQKIKSSSEREKYFKEDGSFDLEMFMNKNFKTVPGVNGGTVAITSRQDFDDIYSNEESAEEIGGLIDQWNTTAKFPDGHNLEGDPIGENEFLYYNKYGEPTIGNKAELLPYIWHQLSELHGGGELLSAEQFKGFWKEGKDFIIGDDGEILNLHDRGNNKAVQEAVDKVKPIVEGFNQESKNALNNLVSSGKIGEVSKHIKAIGIDEARTLSANWKDAPKEIKASETPFDFLTGDMIDRRSGGGTTNRWVFKDSVTNWIKANTGKLWKNEQSGRVYMVLGQQDTGNRNSTERMFLMDMGSGEIVEFGTEQGGGGLNRSLRGDKYGD